MSRHELANVIVYIDTHQTSQTKRTILYYSDMFSINSCALSLVHNGCIKIFQMSLAGGSLN